MRILISVGVLSVAISKGPLCLLMILAFALGAGKLAAEYARSES